MSRTELSASRLSSVVRGTGPGLLLAHGAGGSIQANYGPVLASLTQKFTVVAPDLPGSGATPRSTTPLELDVLADQLVASALDAGLETFAISGYSMGTAVAIRAATKYPEKVTALVLTAGFPKLDQSSRDKTEKWRTLLGNSRDAMARYVLSVMVSEQYLKRLTPQQFDGFAELIGQAVPPGAPDHIEFILKVDMTEDLPKLKVPTLVIAATGDKLLTPQLSKDLADGITGSKYVELDCGHATALEKAAPWAAMIENFLT